MDGLVRIGASIALLALAAVLWASNIDYREALVGGSVVLALFLWIPTLVRIWSRRRKKVAPARPLRESILNGLIAEAAGFKEQYSTILALPETGARATALGQLRHHLAAWTEVAMAKLKTVLSEDASSLTVRSPASKMEDLDGWIDGLKALRAK